ncbi:MAG: glycerophosphodiester phosphodiesterase family protein [Gemmatimonadota bacterium]
MFPLLDTSAKLVIAHRGNSRHAPEDTMESFRQGLALGADGIEFDVRLSADGVPVVIHDRTLDRTTSGTGLVADRTFDELRALDAGYRFTRDGGRTFPYRGRGMRIPALDEVLEAFPATACIIELKTPTATAALARALEAHDARERVVAGSFLDEALAPLRGRGFLLTASRPEVIRLYARALTLRGAGTPSYQACSVPPWFHGLPVPVLQFARMLRGCGIPTHVWTVNDVRQARRLWAGGVNAILSDDPGAMLGILGRPERAGPPAEPR